MTHGKTRSRSFSLFVALGLWVTLAPLSVSASEPAPATAPASEAVQPPSAENPIARMGIGEMVVSANGYVGEGAAFGIDSRPKESEAAAPGEAGEWVFAPVPGFSPTFGATLAAGVAKIYTPKAAGKDAPPWTTGGGVFGAENKSWGVGLGHKMNLDNDRWRILGVATYADLIYQYYGIGNSAGDEDEGVDLNHRVAGGVLSMLRGVGSRWYLGLVAAAADSRIALADPVVPPDFEYPPGWPPGQSTVELMLTSVAPTVQYDSRDNEFYPTSGILFEGKVGIFSEDLGSDVDFQTYQLSYNQYFSRSADEVVAVRVHGRYADGDVPFFALSSLGQGGDIRGYTPGRYRDNALLTAQAEYRRHLSESWVAVVFAGVGAVGPSLREIGQALPGVGFGVRYVVAKENHVSLRLDMAWGRDDSAFYLSVGEAF